MTNDDHLNAEVIDRATLIAAMRAALVNLKVDDDGLTRRNSLGDIEYAARVSACVTAACADGASPRDLLAGRLAHCTRKLLCTLYDFGDDDRQIVREYVMARAELMALD